MPATLSPDIIQRMAGAFGAQNAPCSGHRLLTPALIRAATGETGRSASMSNCTCPTPRPGNGAIPLPLRRRRASAGGLGIGAIVGYGHRYGSRISFASELETWTLLVHV